MKRTRKKPSEVKVGQIWHFTPNDPFADGWELEIKEIESGTFQRYAKVFNMRRKKEDTITIDDLQKFYTLKTE